MGLVAVLDVETTGLVAARERVVEIGIVLLDEFGQVVGELESLINPGRGVGPSFIHHIYDNDVQSAPSFSEFAGTIFRFLQPAKVLVGHNVRFDWSFLSCEASRMGIELPPVPTYCTRRLAGGGRLAEVCRRFGVVNSHEHSALGDARATGQVFSKMMLDPKMTLVQTLLELAPVSWPTELEESPPPLTRKQSREARKKKSGSGS